MVNQIYTHGSLQYPLPKILDTYDTILNANDYLADNLGKKEEF